MESHLATIESLTTRLTAAESRASACEKLLSAAQGGLQHYADESFWDDPVQDSGYARESQYNYEDEIDGQIAGHFIAREVLRAIAESLTALAEPVADTEEVER